MQTRASSFVESCLNVGSGFVLSFVIWQNLGPAMGYDVSLTDNFQITSIFTLASVLRGYVWRRYFNHRVMQRYT